MHIFVGYPGTQNSRENDISIFGNLCVAVIIVNKLALQKTLIKATKPYKYTRTVVVVAVTIIIAVGAVDVVHCPSSMEIKIWFAAKFVVIDSTTQKKNDLKIVEQLYDLNGIDSIDKNGCDLNAKRGGIQSEGEQKQKLNDGKPKCEHH